MAEGGVAAPEDGAYGEGGEASDVAGASEVAGAHVGVIYTVSGMWLI